MLPDHSCTCRTVLQLSPFVAVTLLYHCLVHVVSSVAYAMLIDVIFTSRTCDIRSMFRKVNLFIHFLACGSKVDFFTARCTSA